MIISHTKVVGRGTKCMDAVITNGRMESTMMVSMNTIRNLGLASFTGQMGSNTKGIGGMANSMAEAS